MLDILLALQLATSSNNAGSKSTPSPDSSLRLGVDSATRAFQISWREAWQDTQHQRPLRFAGDNPFDTDERSLALHCHWIGPSLRIRSHIITGNVRAHAICPVWYPPDGAKLDDERHGIDGGLARDARGAIRVLRASLRSLLDSAARQLPGDARIAGQRVRFALDAQAFADAWNAAASCTSEIGQCGLLRGLVYYRAGHVFAADSAFLVAAANMAEARRCRWNDISVLLDEATRKSYNSLACTDRAEMERKVWWLSDPLYLEPGNERRAEHFARKTLVSLLAPLGVDERQQWRPERGGEAVEEALIRYGWPSQMYWGGPFVDRGHDNWLRAQGLDTAGPYVVRQYTRNRFRTLPLAHALLSPFDATPDDWKLNTPPKGDEEEWPIEHFARDASRLVQLPVGQSVMWRRKTATRFVWAGNLDAAALLRRATDSVRVAVFESREINDITTVGVFDGQLGRPFVIDAMLPAGAALLSIEIPGDSTHAAARTRFGQHLANPLNAAADSTSLSQPALLDASYDANVLLDADAAARHMFGSTTLTKPRRVGIYWEAYGFTVNDTVDLEVQISREDRPGIFSRVFGAFRLGQERDANVGIRWREAPGNSRAIHRLEGDVPMQMRSVVLDIAGLARGSYRLQISMAGTRGTAATSDRAFAIR